MFTLIISIIFILSFGGVAFILAKKIPVLVSLPQNGTTGIKKHHIILETEEKIKEFIVYVQKQILLHKLLSWIKVMILKIERRVDNMLHGIRKKAQQVDRKNKPE